MRSHRPDDDDLVEAINRSTGTRLMVRGRSTTGELGGGVFVEWPDGRPGVVTIFQGGVRNARLVADLLNSLQTRGLPVPRHELVVDLGDRVVFVQQRLPSGPSRPLSPHRVDGIAEINERFAGAVVDVPTVPSVSEWFRSGEREVRPAARVDPRARSSSTSGGRGDRPPHRRRSGRCARR